MKSALSFIEVINILSLLYISVTASILILLWMQDFLVLRIILFYEIVSQWIVCLDNTARGTVSVIVLGVPTYFCGLGDKNMVSGLEIADCQWPKAGHILEMAGKNKFELPK